MYPHRDLDALEHPPARAHRRPARARRQRHRVLDGRRRRRRRRARRALRAATTRCSCSTRPTPSSGPSSASPGPTVLRVGTLSKTLGALGGFVAGPARAHRARREPGPLVHLHHRDLDPADAAAALAAVRDRARLRGRRCCGRGSGRNVDELRPGHPSPIVPVPVRRRGPGGRRRRRPCSSSACWFPRSGPRPCRPARRACGSRSRPRTRSIRSPPSGVRSKASASRDESPADRHRDRSRQDLVGAGHGRCAANERRRRRGAEARAVLRTRRARHDRCGAPRARERRAGRDGLPASPLVRGADGTTDGG